MLASTTINIIGCGNLGKTLGRLWNSHQTFVLQEVMNRSLDSANRAVAFIGAGRAVDRYADLQPADVILIATPDDQIAQCCTDLAQAAMFSSTTVVFHCSGSLPSSALQVASQQGAAVASIHPIRSFAMPAKVAQEFAGTWCGAEGDQRALDLLVPGFQAIGAKLAFIDPEFKMLYHAAAVFASNYLVTLLDVAQQAYARAGIPHDAALKIMEPLVRKSIDDVFHAGPAKALSGPIARGDMATVEKQHKAIAAWDLQRADLYQQFAKLTAELAARR